MRCAIAPRVGTPVLCRRANAVCSSQNGPIHLDADSLPFENKFSWDNVADYVWIDQPV